MLSRNCFYEFVILFIQRLSVRMSGKESLNPLKKLKNFFECREGFNENIFSNLIDIENEFNKRARNNMKQLTFEDILKQ